MEERRTKIKRETGETFLKTRGGVFKKPFFLGGEK